MKASSEPTFHRFGYYPFGMLMPGRQFGQGENFPGVLVNGTTTVNGYTLPIDLNLSSRGAGDPAEYVASNSVEFGGEFESGATDEFSAYISDNTYAGSGNLVSGGGAYGTAGRYRYGFNGKENDNEVKGVGNQQDYGMRIYDPKLGKFLSVDPLTKEYPWNSTYAFAENSPIKFIDLDGLERARHWYDYSISDLISWAGGEKWSDFKKGEGDTYKAVDGVNRTINPVGIVATNGYALATGKDLITNQQSSRVDAAGNLIIAGIFHQAGTQLVKPTAAMQLEKQMVANSAAMDGLPKPKNNGISVKDTRPQIGDEFGSQAYNLTEGKINLNNRSVTNGTFDFVVTNEGKLVIGKGHYNLSGQATEVRAAGQLRILKGKVMDVNNSSGHYRPTVEEASKFGDVLKEAGVDVTGTKLNLYNPEGAKINTVTVQ